MDKEENSIKKIQKRICSRAMLGALVVAFFFLVIGEKAVAKGLVLGTLFSVFNFILLGMTLPMTLGRSRAHASFIGFVSILLRYIILAIPLIVAFKSVSFNFVAAAIGIFAIQAVTLLDFVIIGPRLEDQIHQGR